MKTFDSVASLSEQELLEHFEALVVRDRRTTAELLIAIAEIDERKLWAAHACSSMFTFCMERFHMSEQVTAKRLWAARTARRFPVVLEMVARGELHLGAIHLLARHLTEENHVRVLDRAKHKSSREVERLAAKLAPRADVASRVRAMPDHRGMVAESMDQARAHHDQAGSARADGAGDGEDLANGGYRADRHDATDVAADQRSPRAAQVKPIIPLSPRRYKIEITVDEATHDKLRSLQDLLGRSDTGRDPAAIISGAIDVLLTRTLARKAGCTDRPRPMNPAASRDTGRNDKPAWPNAAADASRCASRTRRIPAAVRREVWTRDSGRCCSWMFRGRRCGGTSNVEFHHKSPFARGGEATPENIELRCAAHNQFQADLDFGRGFMDARRGNVAEAPNAKRSGDVAASRTRSGAGVAQRGKMPGQTFPGERTLDEDAVASRGCDRAMIASDRAGNQPAKFSGIGSIVNIASAAMVTEQPA